MMTRLLLGSMAIWLFGFSVGLGVVSTGEVAGQMASLGAGLILFGASYLVGRK